MRERFCFDTPIWVIYHHHVTLVFVWQHLPDRNPSSCSMPYTGSHDAYMCASFLPSPAAVSRQQQRVLYCVCATTLRAASHTFVRRFVAPLPQTALPEIDHQQNVWNAENVFL